MLAASLFCCAGVLALVFGGLVLVIFVVTFFFDALENVVNSARGEGWFSGK